MFQRQCGILRPQPRKAAPPPLLFTLVEVFHIGATAECLLQFNLDKMIIQFLSVFLIQCQ